MKIWLFALLQSIIASLGLIAYFWADNMMLATVAAVAAASLGACQPLISAYKQRRLQSYHDRQYQKSIDAVDGQLKDLLDGTIEPPLPHRPSVAAVLRHCFGQQVKPLLAEYDEVVDAITTGSPNAAALAADFADRVDPWSVGAYLQGLAALRASNLETAHVHFWNATQQQSNWVAPWLGWATTAYRLGRTDEIRENHPHIRGVEILPYDTGDEDSFLKITEAEQQQLTSLFQRSASALGNYYAIAEFCRSKDQIAASREELKKVA